MPGQILVDIEREFQISISYHFDLIAGTSTGEILASAFLLPHPDNAKKPKFNSEEEVGLYFELGDQIFDIPFFHKVKSVEGILDEKYPADGIEKALREYLGDCLVERPLKTLIDYLMKLKTEKATFLDNTKREMIPNSTLE